MSRSIYPSDLYLDDKSSKKLSSITESECTEIAKKPLPLKATRHIKYLTAPYLISHIHSFYRKWANFVDKFTIPILVIAVILTGIGTFKVLNTPRKNDITNYTPYGVRSRTELAIRQEFFNENGAYIYFLIVARPLRGKNIIHVDYLRELVELDDIIRTNFTIRNHYTNEMQSYSQFCNRLCDINEPLRMFYFGYSLQEEFKSNNQSYDDTIKLNYPIIEILGRKVNIQLNFYGITFKNDTVNDGAGQFTNIKAAETASLFYQAERVGGWTDEEVKEYEMSMHNYFWNKYKSKNLKIMTASRKLAEEEFIRAGMKLVPLLLIGFVIMTIVASITVMISAFYVKQAGFNKIVIAVIASACPFMASFTALGILLFLGVRFGSILLLSPFLLLVIGLDDSYLMIHSWQRIVEKRRQEPARIDDSAADRIAEVLIETGPSIMISALTNIFADAVGAFTGSPEITLLCIGTMLSVVIDFIFQITVFTAVMIILGKREMANETKLRHIIEQTIEERSQGETEESCHKNWNNLFNRFVAGYVQFITHGLVTTIVVLVWIAFIVVSAWMTSKLQVNLTTEKLVAEDSVMRELDWYKENVMLPTYITANVFVNHPGDLSDRVRVDRLNHLVAELESLPESWGANTTRYFIRDFLTYEKDNQEENLIASLQAKQFETKPNTTNLPSFSITPTNIKINESDLLDFINWDEYSQWKAMLKIRTDKNETCLTSFFFTTAYHGPQLKIYIEKAKLLKRLRRIVDKYADEFNASLYRVPYR